MWAHTAVDPGFGALVLCSIFTLSGWVSLPGSNTTLFTSVDAEESWSLLCSGWVGCCSSITCVYSMLTNEVSFSIGVCTHERGARRQTQQCFRAFASGQETVVKGERSLSHQGDPADIFRRYFTKNLARYHVVSCDTWRSVKVSKGEEREMELRGERKGKQENIYKITKYKSLFCPCWRKERRMGKRRKEKGRRRRSQQKTNTQRTVTTTQQQKTTTTKQNTNTTSTSRSKAQGLRHSHCHVLLLSLLL